MADEDDEGKQLPIYDDEDEQENGVFRWMSAAVVLLAVAGFFGLAWYAYRNGGESVDEKDVELVQADKTPVKEAPANPGGMQIPNQDKTVYGLIGEKNEKPVVERILPAPEEPMARNADTKTWMSDRVKNKDGDAEQKTASNDAKEEAASKQEAPKEQFNPKARTEHADGTPMKPDTTAPAAPAEKAAKAPALPEATKAEPAAGTSAAAPAPAPAPALKPTPAAVPQKPAPAPKSATNAATDSDSQDEDAEAKPDKKPEPKKAEAKTSSGPAGVRVQLGSYKSQSEAERNWGKIAHQFSELSGKQHYVARADLGAKGIYYRLQAAPFGSTGEAEEFCLNLVSSGQACLPTKAK